MTSLSFSSMTLPGVPLEESCLPPILTQKNVQTQKGLQLAEEDEVFWDLGRINTLLPYRMQNLFTRERRPMTVKTAVLENAYLKAVFLPDYGAKLWSLYDKQAGKNLLYTNDCIQPGNLALRGAWMSGGVEWNVGLIGHSPYTCEPLSMAHLVDEDGSDVLRFYAFERIREAVYQMDFSLPEDSRVLLCRMRIKNTQSHTIPMYWFSNIAVPELPRGRVIVPAATTFRSDVSGVGSTTVPLDDNGVDITYPVHTMPACDYFYKIPEKRRKFIAYVDGEGDGLFQTSTLRQKGRKLFVWGQGAGSATWQSWLTDQAGRYVEIQAGVGRTQYECIPMPPNVAWEWVEAYGPLHADSDTVHGEYTAAVAEAERRIEEVVAEDWLEEYRIATRERTKRPAVLVQHGTDAGWAALENRRRAQTGQAPMEPHLDFGEPADAQKEWLALLENGVFPRASAEPPASFMCAPAWKAMLEECAEEKGREDWRVFFHLGLLYLNDGCPQEAARQFTRSLACRENAWAHYGLAVLAYQENDRQAVDHIIRAMEGNRERLEMLRDYFEILVRFGEYRRVRDEFASLPTGLQKDGRLRYGVVRALTGEGQLEAAQALMLEDGGLQIPDLREGDNLLSDAWLDIQQKKAEEKGEVFHRETAPVPQQLDFRMKY